jgi:hypothetical protein
VTQLDIFTSLGRDTESASLVARVESATSTSCTAAAFTSRPGDSCEECGSDDDVLLGRCRDCFDRWQEGL